MPVFANLLGAVWRWLSPPPPSDDEGVSIAVSQPASQGAKPPPMQKPKGRYSEILMAVESRLSYLMRVEIPEHLDIAKHDVLELLYLEIEPSDHGQALLKSFFTEFGPAARQERIREMLGENAAIKLDRFAGIYDRDNLPDTTSLDKHEQMLNQGVRPTYSVYVWSRWVRPTMPASSPPPPGGNINGQPVVLRVQDARGPQPDIHQSTYPLTIGRSGSCAVVVAGTFVSGSHCSLHSEQGKIWLEDHSKNGTWIDGRKAPKQQRVELSTGHHRLKLGKEAGEAKDCPDIELEFFATPIAAMDSGATPIDASDATPVMNVAKLLAVLSIEDAMGKSRLRDVLRLPYTLGRAEDRDYTTPPAHAGVSGKHLTIQEITNTGARVLNEAHEKNGTALDGQLQPAEFFWPFDSTIALAPKRRQDPPVLITLKRPV